MITDIMDPDQIVALNPRLRMRKDVDRIYIFPLNPFTHQAEHKRSFIRSAEAILFALFDGNKPVRVVAQDLSYILEIAQPVALSIIRNFLSQYKAYMVTVSLDNHDQIKRYDPSDFVVNRKATDILTAHPKLPEVAMFLPTLACHFNCRYCYAPRHNNSAVLSLETISMFAEQLNSWGIPVLFFSGGDPLKDNNIRAIIDICRQHRLKPIIPTKSVLEDNDIDFLVRSEVNELQISLDSANDPLTSMLIGAPPGYVPAILASIKRIISGGLTVNINTVVTAFNVRFIPDLITRLAEMQVNQITLSPYARSLYNHRDHLFCHPDDYKWLDEQVMLCRTKHPATALSYKYLKDHSYMTREEKEVFYRDRPECMAGKNGLIILPNGQVTICETLYFEDRLVIGDLHRQTLHDVWFSEKRQDIIGRGDEILAAGPCASCDDRVSCYRGKGKCYVRALQAFDDAGMPDPYCPRSEGGKRVL